MEENFKMALKNSKEFIGSLFCHTIRFYSIKIALAGFEVTCDQLVLLSLQVSWKVGIFCKLVQRDYAHAILRTDKHFLASQAMSWQVHVSYIGHSQNGELTAVKNTCKLPQKCRATG